MTKRAAKKSGSPRTARPARKNDSRKLSVTKRRSSPTDYTDILIDVKRLIADSRHRALTTVNRELVCLYWQIGRVIVRQQESANWGDAVVEQLAADLRMEFPDMKGLSRDNVFRMRQFFMSCRDLDAWYVETFSVSNTATHIGALSRQLPPEKVATAPRQLEPAATLENVATAPRQIAGGQMSNEFVATAPPQFSSETLLGIVTGVSWSHHKEIIGAVSDSPERYFYMAMSARERWSVRELRRQIESGLYLRYMSVRRDPEKCLPADVEQGDLLPFKDHYILEFLGLSDEHSERDLRHAILANLRDFFLEFGRDLTFVGEEYPLTVGNDTFSIDLVFFHRRLQCLIAVDLKIGSFQPEYVGKSLFYVAALDEQIRLPHEQPSIGLILCRDADHAQVRLALTPAAKKVGVATYETALPDLRLIRQRLEQFPMPKEVLR